MSVATTVDPPHVPAHRALVSALFAVHRRVVVRAADGAAGPVFCTCGDVWPCRNEELAARVLDVVAERPGLERVGTQAADLADMARTNTGLGYREQARFAYVEADIAEVEKRIG